MSHEHTTEMAQTEQREMNAVRYRGSNILAWAALLVGFVMAVKGAIVPGGLMMVGAFIAMPAARWFLGIRVTTLAGWALYLVGVALISL